MPFDFLRRRKGEPGDAADGAAATELGERGVPFDGMTEEWRLVAGGSGRVAIATSSVLVRSAGPRADRVHDARIGQRRRVAQDAPLGDVAQQPPHDLA